ncbi:MAG TPA: hypothetical protein VF139_01455 [Candidatus Polarisedimenticolaceae bacterium]
MKANWGQQPNFQPEKAPLREEPRNSVAVPSFAPWSLPSLEGRLVEISGDVAGAPLTLVFRLVLEAQRRGEPAAWVGRRDSIFYPPDVAEAGIDLAAFPVVWTPDAIRAAEAADLLLRSGAFGLVVVDFGAASRLPMHAPNRLAALAQKHTAVVACLTEKDAERPSLGALVSVRAHAAREERLDDRFRCALRFVKDKRRAPGARHVEIFRGPDGLH